MPVADLMIKEISYIDGSAVVSEAIQQMKSKNISSLVVKPRNDDDTYGIVTERDILEKVIDPGEDVHRDPWNTQVHTIMSKPLITVHPQMRLKYALRLMKRVAIRRLAVMEGSKLVGILSETDILHVVETMIPGKSGKTAL